MLLRVVYLRKIFFIKKLIYISNDKSVFFIIFYYCYYYSESTGYNFCLYPIVEMIYYYIYI